MNKDRLMLGAAVLIGLAAAYFLYLYDPTDDPDALTPRSERDIFGPAKTDEANGGVRREPSVPAPYEREVGTRGDSEESPAEPVTTLDDFENPHAAVEIRVQDASGEPFPNAAVTLYRLNRAMLLGDRRGAELNRAVTDAEGLARIDAIETTFTYALRVYAPGFRRFEFRPLDLVPGQLTKKTVTMISGFTLQGRVTTKESGGAVPGAEVLVYDLADPTLDPEDSVEARAVCGADGTYEMPGLTAGPKRICVRARDYGSVTRPHLAMTAAEPVLTLDFELPAGQSIAGMVMDTDGRPLSGAEVGIFPVKGQLNTAPLAWYPAVRTDASGRFQADGLVPGLYFLKATKPGYAAGNFTFRDGERGPNRTSMVNARAGDRGLELYLGKGPTVAGRVIDAESGEPVTAYDLYADSMKDPKDLEPTTRQRVLSGDGRFDYGIRVLTTQARHVWLHVRAPGFAGGRILLDFAKDKVGLTGLRTRLEDVTIKLERGVSLSGLVTDSAGRPVEGVLVSALRKLEPRRRVNPTLVNRDVITWGHAKTGRTNDKGRFEVRALRDGKHRVTLEHPEFAYHVLPDLVTVSGSDVDAGGVQLERGGLVRGVVLDDDGRPEEGARVELAPVKRGTTKTFSARTGLSGAFVFSNVPVGQFSLMVVERNGLDTRSALYQKMKDRNPRVIPVSVAEGVVLRFELTD